MFQTDFYKHSMNISTDEYKQLIESLQNFIWQLANSSDSQIAADF
jgi:hypothetical protein